ncbi:hypothetical protein [Synechococcus sp. A18-25c]
MIPFAVKFIALSWSLIIVDVANGNDRGESLSHVSHGSSRQPSLRRE